MSQAGLPQLDTALFPEQLFWLAVSFALLYLLMAYVVVPAVRCTQDKRAGAISSELAAAQVANDAAKSMMTQYEKALADARTKAQATVSEVAAQAAKESAAERTGQQQKLSKRLSEAEAKITAAREKAIRDVKDTAVDLASAIVEKMIQAQLNSIHTER